MKHLNVNRPAPDYLMFSKITLRETYPLVRSEVNTYIKGRRIAYPVRNCQEILLKSIKMT